MNTSLHKPPTTSDEAISTREQKRSCRKGDSAIEKEGEPPGEWMSDRLLKGSKLRRMEKMNLQTKKKKRFISPEHGCLGEGSLDTC